MMKDAPEGLKAIYALGRILIELSQLNPEARQVCLLRAEALLKVLGS